MTRCCSSSIAGLYFRKDEVADLETVPSLRAAKIVSPGNDVTIITYSKMVWEAVTAATELESARQYRPRSIDLRSLSPLDMDTIVRSVQRTSRALVVHEAVIQRWARRGDQRADPGSRIRLAGRSGPAGRRAVRARAGEPGPGGRVRAQCQADCRERGADARSRGLKPRQDFGALVVQSIAPALFGDRGL